MLGLKQPCHKKHSPEKVGWHLAKDQSWGKLFRSSVQVNYSRTDLCDPGLFAIISHNYAKIQNAVVLIKINLSYPNFKFFTREWLNCLSNSDHGPLTAHFGDRCV